MHNSVPSASYSSVCNVLRQWSISLIPTYRVYRLYDTDAMFTVFIIMSCKIILDTEVQGPSLTSEWNAAMEPSTGTVLVRAWAIVSLFFRFFNATYMQFQKFSCLPCVSSSALPLQSLLLHFRASRACHACPIHFLSPQCSRDKRDAPLTQYITNT